MVINRLEVEFKSKRQVTSLPGMAQKQFIEENLGRANLGTFLVFGSGCGWENEGKALAEMWTDTTRDEYRVTVTFDGWDKHPETKGQGTQGTIVLDGVERNWRLIPYPTCEPLSGSAISIEMPNDSDDWHVDWVLRPDWCVINYLVLDALVTRNPCDPTMNPEVVQDVEEREEMTRLRQYVKARGLITLQEIIEAHHWLASPRVKKRDSSSPKQSESGFGGTSWQ